jgi:malate dehydrogenase
LYIGVPVKLGSLGIEEIIEVELSQEEKDNLSRSAAAVTELVEVMQTRNS